MTDASITAVSAINIAKLIERVQQSRDPDARELAARAAEALQHPDKRVGAALLPKGRGGEPDWLAGQRAERAAGYREFAVADYGTVHLTPKQANALARKAKRLLATARLAEGAGDARLDAVRRIMASGLDPIGGRQLLRVLSNSKSEKKL